jgi:hypothetical protein
MNDIERIARITSTDVQTIRLMLQQGCEFGTAFKVPNSRRFTYLLYPEKVRELFGFDIKGKVQDDKEHNRACAGNCDQCDSNAAKRENS